jgi:large subunit ribosomal protein L37Ae
MKRIKTPFGARYGSTLRKRYAELIQEYRKPKSCPRCEKVGGIKRIKIGIWYCKKCGAKFTGAAFALSSDIGRAIRRMPVKEIAQKPNEISGNNI